jgi:predicted SprT family Zn-dependent metalloprotease
MELRHAEALAVKLMAQHGLCADPTWDYSKRAGWAGSNPKSWKFEWDNAYRRFGVCKHWQRIIGMSKKLVAINGEAEVTDTILHEIAHALAPSGANHGEEWKAICRRIGARPVACYSSTEVATVVAKFEGRCPTCNRLYTKFKRPSSGRTYKCRCNPGASFSDARYAIVFRKVGDIVQQPRGNARTMGGLVVPTGRPPMVPIQPPIKFNPVVPDAVAWYAGRLLPIELVTAIKEENVATLNPEQIAYIQRIQQERGISYKSAVQYWRRNLKPAQVCPCGMTEPHNHSIAAIQKENPTPLPPALPVVRPYQSAPVDQTETILCDVPAPVAVDPTPIPTPPAAGTGKWDKDIAIFMYQKGCTQIDIAEAMGYPRGQGQTRVRRALVAAGVWHGAN